MPRIYDDQGTAIASIPISAKQMISLGNGMTIRILFRTPQLLVGQLGRIGKEGSFALFMAGDRITTDDPGMVRRYDELQNSIAVARQGSK